jgi:HEAT repeat protein
VEDLTMPQNAAELLTLDEAALVKIVQDPGASVFQKNVACRRLAVIGTKAAVPALAALLTDEKLAHYARFALGPIPDPSVDEALRAAMPKLKGKLLIGVVNTVGQRRDERALEPLARLFRDLDVEVAQAAAAAVGSIGGPTAAKILRDALARTKGPVRTAVAEAALVCAESLDRKAGIELYDTLSRLDIPKPVRMAAMHSAFLAEAWERR